LLGIFKALLQEKKVVLGNPELKKAELKKETRQGTAYLINSASFNSFLAWVRYSNAFNE